MHTARFSWLRLAILALGTLPMGGCVWLRSPPEFAIEQMSAETVEVLLYYEQLPDTRLAFEPLWRRRGFTLARRREETGAPFLRVLLRMRPPLEDFGGGAALILHRCGEREGPQSVMAMVQSDPFATDKLGHALPPGVYLAEFNLFGRNPRPLKWLGMDGKAAEPGAYCFSVEITDMLIRPLISEEIPAVVSARR